MPPKVEVSMEMIKKPCTKTARIFKINEDFIEIQDDKAIKVPTKCKRCKKVKPSTSNHVQWEVRSIENTNVFLVSVNDRECVCKDPPRAKRPPLFPEGQSLSWTQEELETFDQVCSKLGVKMPKFTGPCLNYHPSEEEFFGRDFMDPFE